MNKQILVIVCVFLVSCASTKPEKQTALQQTFEQWSAIAAQYRGTNTDLSKPSKRAIVLGKPELAEKPYLSAYNSEFGRKQFGVESLYQIFLVYIDQSNPARDLLKAKKYLDQMKVEWPKSDQTKKAESIYAKSSS